MPQGKITPSEQLRLNMSTPVTAEPNRLGVIGGDTQGFPNGRRLGDDVIDIALQVVEGELVGSANDLGDGVNANDAAFGGTFPYLALPASGSNADPHPSAGGAAKQSSSQGGALQGIAPEPSELDGVRRCGPPGPDRRHRWRHAAPQGLTCTSVSPAARPPCRAVGLHPRSTRSNAHTSEGRPCARASS